ncbi:hypothetical protein EP232_01320, partial [bacterium]
RYEQMKKAVMEIVGTHFRPEFINRVDDTVVFHSLEKNQIREIARLQVEILARRVEEQGMKLDVTPEALEFLGNVGFDPVYGARPLKRAIQKHLENPLAQELLAGRYGQGDVIRVNLEQGELVFTAVDADQTKESDEDLRTGT